MIIHEGYKNINIVSPVVTLGIFDGVHRGHRALLDDLVSRAKEMEGESVVITFSPHPRLALEQNPANLSFLTTMEEKKVLLEKTNVGHLIIIEFTKQFSRISACDFIKEILVGKIGTKHLIIGYNHHFGRSGEGDFDTIKQCAESLDFIVEQVQGFHTEEGAISSSLIREALLWGRLDDANKWLGYYYSISGTIVEGRQIGRSLGFPTANIIPGYQYKLIPANGVYAVQVQLDGLIYPGMLSIGSNPTVNNDSNARSIEVHILNFDENIYGKAISVIFRKRLREEIKFDNTKQLAEQMEFDKQQVLLLLT
ncbi:MAG: bifunctional riboflavin kinase/FAD synthetase [Bacteroidia bacterium]|nr:bifunctional riboflavin kinase/FAD synthetase [Bacteroidia bacterium]